MVLNQQVAAAIVVALAVVIANSWLMRPDVVIVGMMTTDIVEGSKTTGGAVSYAATVARAFNARNVCILTSTPPGTNLSLFEGQTLKVVESDKPLVFEHTYTWWGNHRKLQVTSQPTVALKRSDLPFRCRSARSLLLGPLIPHDIDIDSFIEPYPLWWKLLGWTEPSDIGLMAQGLQRQLDLEGRVSSVNQPSKQLVNALSPRLTVFLSDVETEVWKNGTVEALAANAKRFLVTRGPIGADEIYPDGSVKLHEAFKLKGDAVDSNGAGDSFATGYMLALIRGHPSPATVANFAGAQACSQGQNCKPTCIADAIRTNIIDL